MICAVVLVIMAAFDLNTFVSNPTLSQFDKCKKKLFEIAAHYNILVPASLAKAELRAVLLDGLIGKGIFSLPASVSRRSQVGEGATADEGLFDPQVSELPEVMSPPVSETPVVQCDATAQKPLTLPPFVPLSVESSSPGSKCPVETALSSPSARERGTGAGVSAPQGVGAEEAGGRDSTENASIKNAGRPIPLPLVAHRPRTALPLHLM